MTIRLAQAQDGPAIAHVLRESFAALRPAYTPAAYARTTPGAETVVARLAEGPTWVAESGGKVVGTVSTVVQGDALHVRSMAVLPEARGGGVGRALLEACERNAKASGCARLTLDSTPFLDAALRLYANAGFRRTGTGDLEGTPLIRMEKALAG